MEFKIAASPSSYLILHMSEGEQIIAESGTFIFSDGLYTVSSKFELKSYKNWLAKLFGGKSLIYKIYRAQESLQLMLSVKDNAELFLVEVEADNSIIFTPGLHFARTELVNLHFHKRDWNSTINDGFKLKTSGSGKLFLKGYGKIILKEIDTEDLVYVDETALIAFEDRLSVKTISKGMKELLTSGEGFIYGISGKGRIWIQTREKGLSSGGGGFISDVLTSVT